MPLRGRAKCCSFKIDLVARPVMFLFRSFFRFWFDLMKQGGERTEALCTVVSSGSHFGHSALCAADLLPGIIPFCAAWFASELNAPNC